MARGYRPARRPGRREFKAEAQAIAREGWKWIDVAVDFPYGHTHHLRKLKGVPTGLAPDEQATIDALNGRVRQARGRISERRRVAG